jgi:hypothetical protein
MPERPRTPCIGICSTALGDTVCRGCKRFAEEVTQWNAYTDEERWSVLNRLDELLVQSVKLKFTIIDVNRLREQIQFQQIQCNFEKDPYCWFYDLLRQGAGQIKNVSNFGAHILEPWQGLSLPELKEKIDLDYYERSVNYYRRYILPAESALKNAAALMS